jgi:hypothetical protein
MVNFRASPRNPLDFVEDSIGGTVKLGSSFRRNVGRGEPLNLRLGLELV